MERRLYDTARVASVLLAAGIGVLLVPLVLALGAQRHHVPAWWSASLVVGAVVALGFAVRIREKVGAHVLYVATFVGLLTFPWVAGADYPATVTPAVYHLAPLTAAATCLLFRRVRLSLLMLLVLQASLLWTEVGGPWDPGLRVTIGNLLFGLAVAAAGQAVLQASRATETSVEEAQGAAIREFTAARSAEARNRAATRWDAYVHDEVLSALSEIADGSPRAGQAARETIDRAESLRVEHIPAPPLAEGLLEATLTLYPDADTVMAVDADAAELPNEVRLSLIEATSEALRNVARHAYPDTATGPAEVLLTHRAHSVEVVVRDRGVGFEKRHVDPSRLGILVSIQGRLDAVGGRASVESSPQQGTRVRLVWREPR